MFVGRHQGELRVSLGGQGQAIEAVLEDGVDVAVRAGLGGPGPGTGRFHPLAPVALGEPQNAQAGAITLLGVRAILEDGLDEGGGVGADGAGPVEQARGRPLQVLAMRLGHVSGIGGVAAPEIAADVGGHALAAMEDLDGGGGAAGVDEFVQEGMGGRSSNGRRHRCGSRC